MKWTNDNTGKLHTHHTPVDPIGFSAGLTIGAAAAIMFLVGVMAVRGL